jgi:hypothetical protein
MINQNKSNEQTELKEANVQMYKMDQCAKG